MAQQSLATIKNWFRTRLKPTQAQYWDTWDSFWHKDDKLPISTVENLTEILSSKATSEALANEVHALEQAIEDKPDVYVDSASIDANALVSLGRTNEMEPVTLQLGTMALYKFWTGTQAAYDAIDPKDAFTIYHVEEE